MKEYTYPCVVFSEKDGCKSIVFPDLPSGITTFEKDEDNKECAEDVLYELLTEFLTAEELPAASPLETLDLETLEETFYHDAKEKPVKKEFFLVTVEIEDETLPKKEKESV